MEVFQKPDTHEIELEGFLNTAYAVFRLNTFPGRGPNNPHYMYLPLHLTNDRLSTDADAQDETVVLESPFYFLSGIEETGRPPCPNEPSANLPSVCLLIGEYGLGKTEFVFQFCAHLLENRLAGAPRPFPINLAMCRWMEPNADRLLNDSLDVRSFSQLLFGPILRKSVGLPAGFLDSVLLPAVHRGDIILILDGVDELVATEHQHERFFAGLRSFLDPGRLQLSRTQFQCLVSMRLEYVMAVDTPTAAALVQQLQRCAHGSFQPTIHFLHVDFLNDSWIESYLRHTTGEKPDLNKFRAFPGFYELLHRPIFLQMLTVIEKVSISFHASQFMHPAQLVRAFVSLARNSEPLAKEAPFSIERDRLAEESGLLWDTDLLARAALTKFEKTGPQFVFSANDLRLFLVPSTEDDANHAEPTAEDAMRAVHKCPFLHQISRKSVVFAHKVFLEYFVARGIVLDLEESGSAFQRLVLNADMRKFLRFLVEEKYPEKDAWYQYTVRCGLDQPAQWALPDASAFARLLPNLERVRRHLLDSMTDPRQIDVPATRLVVKEFLALDAAYELHPLYLTYNYEAVAVFLWRHRWHEDDVVLRTIFERRLEDLGRQLRFSLSTPGDEWVSKRFPNLGRDTIELLAERIADIARRLRFQTVTEMRLEQSVVTEDIRTRMNSVAQPGETVCE